VIWILLSLHVAALSRRYGRAHDMTRECGACSLCCKLTYVVELNKSIDTWCPHCKPGHGGCTIYQDRPTSCRRFICGWLFDVDERKIGDEWFPARCKMIIARSPDRGFLILVDPAFPNAWRREPYHGQLLALARQSFVKIRVGQRFIRLNADGSERQWWRSQAHIEGRSEDVLAEPGPEL
jgi:hypothetical protein